MAATEIETCSPAVHAEWGDRKSYQADQVKTTLFEDNPTYIERDYYSKCWKVAREVYGEAAWRYQRCPVEERDGAVLTWGLIALTYLRGGEVSCRDIPLLMFGKSDSHPTLADINTGIDVRRGSWFSRLLIDDRFEEAVHFAKKEGLGQHAFLLSSTVVHIHGGPVKEYIDCQLQGMDNSNPLKTYYKLRLREVPFDDWGSECKDLGDWQQHLAMILVHSRNYVHRQESIARLGDILDSIGQAHAAHFCQLVAQLEANLLRGYWPEEMAKWQKDLVRKEKEMASMTEHKMKAQTPSTQPSQKISVPTEQKEKSPKKKFWHRFFCAWRVED